MIANRKRALKHKVATHLHSLISSMTTVLSIATCTTNLLHVSNTASFLKEGQHICVYSKVKHFFSLNSFKPHQCAPSCLFFCPLFGSGMDDYMVRVDKKEIIVSKSEHKNVTASVTRSAFLLPLSHLLCSLTLRSANVPINVAMCPQRQRIRKQQASKHGCKKCLIWNTEDVGFRNVVRGRTFVRSQGYKWELLNVNTTFVCLQEAPEHL